MGTSEELFSKLVSILNSPISQEIQQKLIDESINENNVQILDDNDLKELGFKMGERRLILQWKSNQPNRIATGNDLMALATATPPQSLSSPSLHSTPSTSGVTPIRPAANSDIPRRPSSGRLFKNCPVDDILSTRKQVTGTVSGTDLAKKLKQKQLPTKTKRHFFTLVMGRHLMDNCTRLNYPTPDEKADLCESIIAVFPVLKDETATGYGSMFDRKTFTGTLEHYIRCHRANSGNISTLWTNTKHDNSIPVSSDTNEKECLLRELRPNITNSQELLDLMDQTRDSRRSWIKRNNPSITDILKRFPRFQDVPNSIRNEFRAITGTSKRLACEWQQFKSSILKLAAAKGGLDGLLSMVTDDLDEDKKSEVSFKCCVDLLPSPPLKNVKKPRLSAEAVLDYFFIDFEEDTVDSSVSTMTDKGVVQPVLLRVQSRYYVKVDCVAIPIPDCGCFAEAVEFCFMCLMYIILLNCAFFTDFWNISLKLSHQLGKVPHYHISFKPLKMHLWMKMFSFEMDLFYR